MTMTGYNYYDQTTISPSKPPVINYGSVINATTLWFLIVSLKYKNEILKLGMKF